MKANYGRLRPGQVFAVPLDWGGCIACVFARVAPHDKRIALGYFFGVKHAAPDQIDMTSLQAGDEVLVRVVDTEDAARVEWKLLGELPGFDPRLWPAPTFGVWVEGVPCELVMPIDFNEAHANYVPVSEERARELPGFGWAGPDHIVAELSRLVDPQHWQRLVEP